MGDHVKKTGYNKKRVKEKIMFINERVTFHLDAGKRKEKQ